MGKKSGFLSSDISEYVRNWSDFFSHQENENVKDKIKETVDGILVSKDVVLLEILLQMQNTRSIVIQND